ncbi:hypothetical protein FACS189425_10780 [Clostridia bacterium]|nr:hypothetical protein FACS189425_10780 [Clostridia bacterium]
MVDTRYLAKLSKLYLPDAELDELTEDMTFIMNLMDAIQTVELPEADTRPETTALSALRDDVAEPRLPAGTLSGFTIPKLMEGQ